jgi:FtsZ-binding cell division protein ZapB
MQLETFDKLEKKISLVLKTMDRLKEENKQLSSSYSELRVGIGGMKKTSGELEEENRKLKEKLSRIEQTRTQREMRIRAKLEKLVERLGTLESLS